jgi:hypothetical protein
VIQRNVGRMRGMELDELSSVLFTLREGRIVRMDVFASREGALEAASPA